MKFNYRHIKFILKRINFFLLMLLFIFISNIGKAQSNSNPEYRIKAVFLYNFTRFVDWPATSFSSPSSPLIIGVIGTNPFGTSLEEAVEGEKIGTHPIVIQYYKNVSEISNCHILYINQNESDKIKEIIDSLSDKSILTVNDVNNFPRLGGMIRFFTEENKIRLQINATAAKAAQLNISSKLLSIAQIY